MKYEELYKRIYTKLLTSISVTDTLLRGKIIFHFEKWYNENYKNRIIDCISNNNIEEIAIILNELNLYYNLSDFMKLKKTFYDKAFFDFLLISKEIFQLACDGYLKGKFVLKENDYTNYRAKIEKYEKNISPLYIEEYKLELSECYLDLLFLEKKGNVSSYSIRLGNAIK